MNHQETVDALTGAHTRITELKEQIEELTSQVHGTLVGADIVTRICVLEQKVDGLEPPVVPSQLDIEQVAELNTHRFDQLYSILSAQERHTHDIEVSPFKPVRL